MLICQCPSMIQCYWYCIQHLVVTHNCVCTAMWRNHSITVVYKSEDLEHAVLQKRREVDCVIDSRVTLTLSPRLQNSDMKHNKLSQGQHVCTCWSESSILLKRTEATNGRWNINAESEIWCVLMFDWFSSQILPFIRRQQESVLGCVCVNIIMCTFSRCIVKPLIPNKGHGRIHLHNVCFGHKCLISYAFVTSKKKTKS